MKRCKADYYMKYRADRQLIWPFIGLGVIKCLVIGMDFTAATMRMS